VSLLLLYNDGTRISNGDSAEKAGSLTAFADRCALAAFRSPLGT